MIHTPEQRRAIRRLRKLLVRNFPRVFKKHGKPKRPLAFQIHAALHKELPFLSMAEIMLVLGNYTGRPSYLRALIEGAPRCDLDGNVAGSVSLHEAAQAASKLKRIAAHNARVAERHAFIGAMKLTAMTSTLCSEEKS